MVAPAALRKIARENTTRPGTRGISALQRPPGHGTDASVSDAHWNGFASLTFALSTTHASRRVVQRYSVGDPNSPYPNSIRNEAASALYRSTGTLSNEFG